MHFLKLSADLQNPSALDSKVLLDFDHVKNSLKVDDEGQLQIIFLFLSFFFFWVLIPSCFCTLTHFTNFHFPQNFKK